MSNFRFPKSQRICNKKDIELLFGKAESVRKGAIILRSIFRESAKNESLQQVLIVVPKKRVRKAVDRNRIKRQIREIYRLNQEAFKVENPTGKTLLIACIYVGQVDSDYHELEKNYLNAKEKLKKELAGNTD